jgi:TolA-binding protein
MNPKVKLSAYGVLLILAAWCGWSFHANYAAVTRASAEAATNENVVATNEAAATTNETVATNAMTNMASAPASATNLATNGAISNAATGPVVKQGSAVPARTARGRMMGYLAALVGSLIGLGLLIAYDVTQYLGGAAVDLLLEDKGEGARDPEYEKAEEAWANGQFLEAVRLMREFLKARPREQYAALRIAEIYEKDLNNPLAAALEYEEVLKKKLSPERWGWAAVHLCNLYSRLGRQEKTRELLQRIVDDYPKTSAAKKARERLGLPEPESEPEPAAQENPGEPAADAPAPIHEKTKARVKSKPAPPEPPKSNLPPGFRPK